MDVKKAYLSNKIRKILSSTDEPTGYIAGWNTDTESFCLAISGCTDYFLTGLEVNGIYCSLNNIPTTEDELVRICEQHCKNLMVESESLVVLLVCQSNEENDVNIVAKSYSPYYSSINDLILEIISYNPAVLLQARGQIPCLFEVSSDTDALKENIDQALERIKSLFQKAVAGFLLPNSKIIRHSLMEQAPESDETVKQLLKSIQEDDSVAKSKTRKTIQQKIPTVFDIVIQTTGEAALENPFNHSMVIHCQRREFQCASLQIQLDVLIACQESSSTYSIYKLFLSAIEQQLMKINECLLKFTKTSEVYTPVPYHFYPGIWDFPITLVYPHEKTDKELESYRRELHRKLLLPLDRPFLKKLNSHDFALKSSSGYLYNPHEGLTSSGVMDGKSAIVQGIYCYHHYMQDHINDNGWGCAYRSLQTIISWFKHQGYTDANVPTHEEIQKALVSVGDKPESFIGSKKWIGSQEVSFCLDHLINVQSRILFVSSGAEMASKGRELFNHFQDQGTPVMIGGGVLAHTILGVDFNKDTGELKFLILDPHYTGKEDLNIILNKGWCGWKDVKFWDQTAFYNLCLPQRPIHF